MECSQLLQTRLRNVEFADVKVLSGPDGFIFPVNCTEGFRLRLSLILSVTMVSLWYVLEFVGHVPEVRNKIWPAELKMVFVRQSSGSTNNQSRVRHWLCLSASRCGSFGGAGWCSKLWETDPYKCAGRGRCKGLKMLGNCVAKV